MNSEIKKGLEKFINNVDLGGARELNPGEVGRRHEPKGGLKAHRERIHRESKMMNDLPYSFSKPKKEGSRRLVKCLNCGNITVGTKNTVGIICNECHEYSKVEEVINA